VFNFSVKEIDDFASTPGFIAKLAEHPEGSIGRSIAVSVQAFVEAHVDSDAVGKCENSILAQERYLDSAHFDDALKGAVERKDFGAVQALIKARESAPSRIALLQTEMSALKASKYDAFREAWTVTRTRKTGKRDSIEGKVVACDVDGQVRVMKITAHNIWRVYVRIDQGNGKFLDNALPGATSAEFGELSIKYASTAKRFMSAFGHESKTTRDGKEYTCDGTIDGLHASMKSKEYGKLAFGGSVGISTISEDASTWAPSNGS
jgi:hypothetical protein